MAIKQRLDDINEAFLEWDINPSQVEFNAGYQRVGSLWYAATKSKAKEGGEVFTVSIGDWKTGEKKSYYSTSIQHHEIPAVIVPKNYDERKYQDNLNAKRYAWMIYESASSIPNGEPVYLIRKQVFKGILHNVRYSNRHGGILIPLYDSQYSFWGLQVIMPDGTKTWVKKQRIKGCLHFIGGIWPLGNQGIILIAEGYATACSLFLATGYPTAVAFFATNLMPVSHELKHKFPNHRLILCADNDHKTKGNPGVQFAVGAWLEFGDRIIYPSTDYVNGGTDWNDVHCHQGLPYLKTLLPTLIGEDHVIQREYRQH